MCDILQTVSIIIACIAATITSITAIYGIRAWRSEHIGKRKIDLSEQVLCSIYEIREIIKYMRYPIFYKTNQEQSDFDVVNEKYNNQKEAFTNFYKMKYRYMANFDISENDPFKIVSEVSNEILNALKRLERENMKELNRQPITSEKMTMLKEKMGQLEKVVWEDDENDEINNKINKAVFICENICKSANKLGF
jgi:hypothetical protein